MDPDSRSVILFVLSLALMPPVLIKAGARLEEADSDEKRSSGVGLSPRTLSAFILAGFLLVAAGSAVLSLLLSAAAALRLTGAAGTAFTAALFIVCLFLFAQLMVFSLTWGRAHSERYDTKLRFFDALISVFLPVSRACSFFAKKVLRAHGVTEEIGNVTEQDVLEIVDSAEQREVIDEDQREMINNIFELDDVTAGDIMTHRTEIDAVSVESSASELVDAAIEFGTSRIPVYDGTLDNIVGIAYAKDLLKLPPGGSDMSIRELLRPAVFFPESMKARRMLIEFRQSRTQFAVVVDEYGGTAGIVTMEDILESIVGDIEDEYDKDEHLIVKNEDGSLTCNGYAEVEKVFELMGIEELPDDIDSDTVGGLVTGLLMRLPKPGERPSVVRDGLRFTVLDSDSRRITGVSVKRVEPDTADD